MRARGVVAAGTAALALCVAGGVTAATTPAAGGFNCGMANRIAGHQWAIQSAGVSCRRARGIVRQLARKTVPRSAIQKVGIFPGTYSGMRCFGGPTGQKPISVTCAKANGSTLVRAVRVR